MMMMLLLFEWLLVDFLKVLFYYFLGGLVQRVRVACGAQRVCGAQQERTRTQHRETHTTMKSSQMSGRKAGCRNGIDNGVIRAGGRDTNMRSTDLASPRLTRWGLMPNKRALDVGAEVPTGGTVCIKIKINPTLSQQLSYHKADKLRPLPSFYSSPLHPSVSLMLLIAHITSNHIRSLPTSSLLQVIPTFTLCKPISASSCSSILQRRRIIHLSVHYACCEARNERSDWCQAGKTDLSSVSIKNRVLCFVELSLPELKAIVNQLIQWYLAGFKDVENSLDLFIFLFDLLICLTQLTVKRLRLSSTSSAIFLSSQSLPQLSLPSTLSSTYLSNTPFLTSRHKQPLRQQCSCWISLPLFWKVGLKRKSSWTTLAKTWYPSLERL
ncbi:hypothetical protein VP01_211g1 [Puccinia sorghi]|uniref:Uncharacterized protein n=1 Tax=Puccinia sorghi TaxID=27349 RepID=A0A0L6VA50_9BASI|nr:hypothetical protein VP01_211g1 [Puccinia sorghi]